MPSGGHNSKYSKVVSDLVCMAVASSTKSLKNILLDLKERVADPSIIPSVDSVAEWRAKHPEFAADFTRATQKQVLLLADEIKDIADDDNYLYEQTEFGQKIDRGYFEQKKIRIDARKFLATKLARKIYGDTKVEEEVAKIVPLLVSLQRDKKDKDSE